MVYVFRRNGTVMSAPWGKRLFTRFFNDTMSDWQFHAHVIESDGVTVKETFVIRNVSGTEEGLLEIWEHAHRIMEEGPGEAYQHTKYSPLSGIAGSLSGTALGVRVLTRGRNQNPEPRAERPRKASRSGSAAGSGASLSVRCVPHSSRSRAMSALVSSLAARAPSLSRSSAIWRFFSCRARIFCSTLPLSTRR